MKEKIKNFTESNNGKILFILIITTLPLFFNPYIDSTADGLFHSRRFFDIYLSLKNDYFLSFMSEDALYGFGYPTLGMYPYLLMFPFATLQFLGISSTLCCYIYVTFISFLSILTSMLFIKNISKDKDKQFLFIYFYIMNPYRIYNVYGSLAIGQLTAYAILPLVMLALYKIFKSEKHGTYLLILSMILLAYSHILSTILIAVFIMIVCIFKIKELINKPNIIIKLFIATIISIIASSFIIFPILEQLNSTNLACSYGVYNGGCLINILFINKYILYLIGLILIFFILIFLRKHNTIKNKFIAINLILLISQINIFPWEYIPIWKYIQFSHRILLFSGISLGLYIALFSKDIKKSKINIEYYGMFIGLFCLAFTTFSSIGISKGMAEDERITTNFETNIGLGDYLPQNYYLDVIKNNAEAYADYSYFDADKILNINENFNYEIIDKDNIRFYNNHNEYLILPKLFYKGYEVSIDNKTCEIEEGDFGMIKINTKGIEEGTININYVGTNIQNKTREISIVAIIFIIYYGLKCWKQEMTKKKNVVY